MPYKDPDKQKKWREKNKEKIREYNKKYRSLHREKLLQEKIKWYENNKEKEKERVKKWGVENPERVRTYKKHWKLSNKEKIKLYQEGYHLKYCNRRYKNDIQYKLAVSLRGRLYQAVKKEFKTGSAVSDLGCTIPELKAYLESQFQQGMSWENWGRYGWHIDHIIPLSSFDLADKEQLLRAVHYKNLQPLWAEDNLKKNKYYIEEGT